MQVSVLEMDGAFDKLEELIYVESHLSNTSTKFYGEITQQMLKNSHFPGQRPSRGVEGKNIGDQTWGACSCCHQAGQTFHKVFVRGRWHNEGHVIGEQFHLSALHLHGRRL